MTESLRCHALRVGLMLPGNGSDSVLSFSMFQEHQPLSLLVILPHPVQICLQNGSKILAIDASEDPFVRCEIGGGGGVPPSRLSLGEVGASRTSWHDVKHKRTYHIAHRRTCKLSKLRKIGKLCTHITYHNYANYAKANLRHISKLRRFAVLLKAKLRKLRGWPRRSRRRPIQMGRYLKVVRVAEPMMRNRETKQL